MLLILTIENTIPMRRRPQIHSVKRLYIILLRPLVWILNRKHDQGPYIVVYSRLFYHRQLQTIYILIVALWQGWILLSQLEVFGELWYLPANLILSKSKGCNTSVDTTPPVIPAIKCSILTALNVAINRVNRLAALFDGVLDWLPAMFSASFIGAVLRNI